MNAHDPADDQSHLERIVSEFIAGDELLDVIGSLNVYDMALFDVALLRVLRDYPHLFGTAWPMLEQHLYVRAEKEHATRIAEGEVARLDLRDAA